MPPIAADNRQGLLLVDDHTIVREGLKRILESVADEWQITEAGSGFQALECLRRQRFGMAIVDLSMPGMSGLDLIKRVHAEYVGVGLLVLSMHAEEQYALRAFQAGASSPGSSSGCRPLHTMSIGCGPNRRHYLVTDDGKHEPLSVKRK